MQPHLIKCFDSIKKLDFGDSPTSIDIAAMISNEGERLTLTLNLTRNPNPNHNLILTLTLTLTLTLIEP